MTAERRQGRFSFEAVVERAREAALESGGHAPTVIAQGRYGAAIGQLLNLPGAHEGRAQMMYQAGLAFARGGDLGPLEEVYFICEAWMSQAGRDGIFQGRPSEDPERIEVLIVSSLTVDDGTVQLATFEMVRDDHDALVYLQDQGPHQAGGRANSPLLDSFAQGFNRGRRGKLN